MYASAYRRNPDGSISPAMPQRLERLTVAEYQKAYGGKPLTDTSALRINHIPPGTMLWETGAGQIMAIKDE